MFSSTQLTRYLNWCHISVVVGILLIINMAENSHEFAYSDLPVITISVLGVSLNVLLLVAFLKDPLKCFRNSGTYLVMNLAVSDCLTCLFAPSFLVMYVLPGWYWIFKLFVWWFGTVSLVSIASISIDRFLLVAYPIKHHIFMKGKVIILWLAAIWIMSCTLPLKGLFYESKNNEIIAVIIMIISVVIYVCTYWQLRKQAKNIALQNSRESRAQEIRILKEKKFLKTIILIACVAFLSTVPSMLFFQIYDSLTRWNDILVKIFIEIFTFIFYTNFAVNPIIYVIRLPNYRKTFYLLYWRRAR